MDKSQFLQEILDIHNNWTAISGTIDIVKLGDNFTTKNNYSLLHNTKGPFFHEINPLVNELTPDDVWTIIGNGQPDMIINTLNEYEFEVDREGFYEFKALLKWIPGEYDNYGRCIMRDYLEIDHIELNFLESFESRNREIKLNELLSNDFENFFN